MIDLNNEIAFIGAGKVASSLIKSFLKNQLNVTTLISRNINSAKEMAVNFNLKNYSDRIEDIPLSSKIILLTVPDDKIEETANRIASGAASLDDKLFVHLSGTYNSLLLFKLKERGALTASFHIMFTFPSKRAVDFGGCYAAIESDDEEALKILFQLAEKINLKSFSLNKEEKIFYHLTGVAASNFLSAILFEAEKAAQQANIKGKDFYNIVEPIILGTLQNIKKEGAAASVSGPIDRGDLKTVEFHIDALKKNISCGDKRDKILLLNYISNSLILLDAVKEKKGTLSTEHEKIKLQLISSLIEITTILAQ